MSFQSPHHTFSIEDAEKYGVQGAIVLHHIRYWCYLNAKNKKNFHDGRYWMYQTLEDMAENFPYFSRDQVKRELVKLAESGAIIKDNFNKTKFDRTVWYSLKESLRNGEITKSDMAKSPKQKYDIATTIPDTKQILKKDYYPPQGGGDPSDRVGGSFSSLDKLDIDDDLKAKISKEHTEEAVNLAVDRTLKWKGRPNDRAGVMTALKKADEWHDVLEAEEVTENNRKWLEKHSESDGKTINGYQCMIGPDYICYHAGTVSKQFNADNPNMIAEATDWINKKNQK